MAKGGKSLDGAAIDNITAGPQLSPAPEEEAYRNGVADRNDQNQANNMMTVGGSKKNRSKKNMSKKNRSKKKKSKKNMSKKKKSKKNRRKTTLKGGSICKNKLPLNEYEVGAGGVEGDDIETMKGAAEPLLQTMEDARYDEPLNGGGRKSQRRKSQRRKGKGKKK